MKPLIFNQKMIDALTENEYLVLVECVVARCYQFSETDTLKKFIPMVLKDLKLSKDLELRRSAVQANKKLILKQVKAISSEIEAISETLLALPVTEKAEHFESAIINRIKILQGELEQIYQTHDLKSYQNWISSSFSSVHRA